MKFDGKTEIEHQESVETCYSCKGTGKNKGGKINCRHCGGTGKIISELDMISRAIRNFGNERRNGDAS